jgi:hydrogenase maturation protease
VSARYVVLGLGNRLQRDEALGALFVERLGNDPAALGGLGDAGAVDLVDGGTVGLGLVPLLTDLAGLVIVDAIDAGRPPGTVLDLDGTLLGRHDGALSVHDLGARELLGALIALDALPRRVRVVGIQPAAIELGLELTAAVAASVPSLVAAVVGHLAAWQQEDGRDS